MFQPSGLLGDAPAGMATTQYNPMKLPPGIQRFPAPLNQQPCFPIGDIAKQQVSGSKPIPSFSGSSGSILFPSSKMLKAEVSVAASCSNVSVVYTYGFI